MSYKTTLLPDTVSLVQKTSVNFYNTSTNILDAISDYLAELNENIEFEKAKVTPNMLESTAKLFGQLSESNFTIPNVDKEGNIIGEKQLDNNFKLFFIEKYLSLSNDYKNKVEELAQTNLFFKNFSDDVGMAADATAAFDNNVNPIYDTYNQQYFLQTNIPASLINKISTNELTILKTFSYYADPLLKRNLGLLQSGVNEMTAKTAHGQNLVTDIWYYNRAVLNQISILNVLRSVLGNLSSFVLFFKQLNPKDLDPERKAIFFKYTDTNIEGIAVGVDALQNEIEKTILSSEQVLQ